MHRAPSCTVLTVHGDVQGCRRRWNGQRHQMLRAATQLDAIPGSGARNTTTQQRVLMVKPSSRAICTHSWIASVPHHATHGGITFVLLAWENEGQCRRPYCGERQILDKVFSSKIDVLSEIFFTDIKYVIISETDNPTPEKQNRADQTFFS